jgi:ATP-binding cassette, subfamily B, bacterial
MSFQLLRSFAAPYRQRLALASLLVFCESAVALAIPWMAGRFAQDVVTGIGTFASQLLVVLLALLALQSILKYARSLVTGYVCSRMLADMRVRMYDHLQSLPVEFFQNHRQGELIALLSHQVSQLAAFIGLTLLGLGPQLLTIVGAVMLMSRIDFALAGVVLVLIPVFFLLLKILGRRLQPISGELQKAEALGTAIADENLSMLPAIKTFVREREESARYARHMESVRRLGVRQMHIYAAMEPAVQFAAAAGAVALLWLLGERLGAGQMSAAQLVSFLLYAALLTRPIGALAGTYGQVLMARGTLHRLAKVLTERPEPIAKILPSLLAVRGDIEFRHVEFAYPCRPKALQDLSLQVRAGETVALTGDNGAGKSTLAHLLMRLHEPQGGQIFIDGKDIATVSLRSLRSQVGIVPQHVLLFNGSVRDNIGFGRVDADFSAVERASRLAQAHAFISGLPDGYDTIIGDHGVRLSGGQRQRIALARALLKDAPILVLDEATAMFDPAGEAAFIEAWRRRPEHRTVILITHRPASLALADRIIRVQAGRVSVLSGAEQEAALEC